MGDNFLKRDLMKLVLVLIGGGVGAVATAPTGPGAVAGGAAGAILMAIIVNAGGVAKLLAVLAIIIGVILLSGGLLLTGNLSAFLVLGIPLLFIWILFRRK